jgi:hypothetical protein
MRKSNRFVEAPTVVDPIERFRSEIKQTFGSEGTSLDEKLDKLIAHEHFSVIMNEWSVILRDKPEDIECFGVAFGICPRTESRDDEIVELIDRFLKNSNSDLSKLPEILREYSASKESSELLHSKSQENCNEIKDELFKKNAGEVAVLLHRNDVIKIKPVFDEITNNPNTAITQIFLFILLNPIWLGLGKIGQDFFDKLFKLKYSQRLYELYLKLKVGHDVSESFQNYLLDAGFSLVKNKNVEYYPTWFKDSKEALKEKYLDYWGNLSKLWKMIKNAAIKHSNPGHSFMAPYLAIVQSSGHGKSRLLIELGYLQPLKYISLGSKECYPPANHEFSLFAEGIESVSLMVAFLCYIFITAIDPLKGEIRDEF